MPSTILPSYRQPKTKTKHKKSRKKIRRNKKSIRKDLNNLKKIGSNITKGHKQFRQNRLRGEFLL
jgi:hypothetical protein